MSQLLWNIRLLKFPFETLEREAGQAFDPNTVEQEAGRRPSKRDLLFFGNCRAPGPRRAPGGPRAGGTGTPGKSNKVFFYPGGGGDGLFPGRRPGLGGLAPGHWLGPARIFNFHFSNSNWLAPAPAHSAAGLGQALFSFTCQQILIPSQ